MEKKILVISPHTDDELFGVGGTLLKRKRDGYQIKMAVMSCSERYLHHLGRNITEDEQWGEFKKVSKLISTEDPLKFDTCGIRLEEIPQYKIVRWLDELIRSYNPSIIYIPEPSYHQEHKDVYNACISAVRPTGVGKIEEIIAYEIPTSTWSDPSNKFYPNLFEDIEETMEEKIKIFQENYILQYTSDKRDKLGENGIRAHAQYRGFECGVKFAESFNIIRKIKK
jgi:LmbE family N-acetylglucosaminyl deacetylase